MIDLRIWLTLHLVDQAIRVIEWREALRRRWRRWKR